MELARRVESPEEFSPEFKREFVEKIVIKEKTLSDLAGELGIPPDLLRKWTMRVGRDETAWRTDEPLTPTIRILELEHDLADLRREIQNQAITIRILENKYIGR